jgi:hypothetical protein
MLTFYTPQPSIRFTYCVHLLCTEIWDIDFAIVHELPIDTQARLIVYDDAPQPGAFHIVPNGLLHENTIEKKEITVAKRSNNYRYSFFQTSVSASIDFDILSALFYLVSRYEEYIEPLTDNHGRYVCNQSLAHQSGFLEIPLINIWCDELRKVVAHQFAMSIPLKNSFRVVNTIDVDNAFALKNKGWWRTIGGFSKSIAKGKLNQFNQRLKVIKGQLVDPYDTYEYILSVAERCQVDTLFFVLLGDYDRYDKNSSHTNKKFRMLIEQLAQRASVGIHPSYASFLRLEHVGIEQQRLANIVKKDITHSRQHFLRLQLPDSYRVLVENNVQHDYTMGYAEQPGFRASICTPFTFFDLYANEPLPVVVHPFAYMDGTLNEYLRLRPDEAMAKIRELKAVVKQCNGEFIGIWHNDTVGENYHWKGWRPVFEESLS